MSETKTLSIILIKQRLCTVLLPSAPATGTNSHSQGVWLCCNYKTDATMNTYTSSKGIPFKMCWLFSVTELQVTTKAHDG